MELVLWIGGPILLLFLLYLFMVKPGRRRKATLAFTAYNYAHRGLHGADIPENSLAAFRAACEAGYGIELDVQLSRDGVAMVFHDDTLLRVCGIDAPLSDYTAAELGKMTLFGKTEHTIPTFRAVLDTVGGRVPLIVEIKGKRDIDAVCEGAMALLDEYSGPYCVESFSPYVVRWLRRNRPLVVRGQLTEHFTKHPKRRTLAHHVLQSMFFNFLTRPDFIACNYRHRHFFPVAIALSLFRAPSFCWTPKGNEAITEGLGYFDSVIFEDGEPPVKNV